MPARKDPKPNPPASGKLGRRGPKPDDSPPAVPSPGRPEPPAFIVADAVALAHWHATVALIEGAKMLSRVDHDAIAIYCSLWSSWREAIAMVPKTGGGVIKLPNGFYQANPWKTLAIGYHKDMKPYLDMFGLTPKSRSKLKIPEAKEPDGKWDEFED